MGMMPIASGSSGNCIYLGTEDTHVLFDAGISRKRIEEGLNTAGLSLKDIDAIFVTHEHSDHIQGINMMVKMFDTPVYATGGTLDAIRLKDKKGIMSMNHLFEVHADEPVSMGAITVMPFSTSHDAADPVGYTLTAEGHKTSIATDLGKYDDYTIDHLKDTDVLFIEANHDISMLEAGKYPYKLKRRILSEYGHLSNEDSGSLLCKVINKNLKYAFLAHLSKENNYPQLAFEAVKCQLWEEMGLKDLDFDLSVAKRDEPSKMVVL